VRGLGTLRSDDIRVIGTDTAFQDFLIPGDRIRARGQTRVVTLIRSDTELVVASPFNPALASGTEYDRVGTEQERGEGYTFLTNPAAAVVGGNAIMDYAADLAARTTRPRTRA
jgi:hypothetical protein